MLTPEQFWFETAKDYSNGDTPEIAGVVGSVGSPVHYDIKGADAAYQLSLTRVCISIVDGGLQPAKFAGLSALTNGIKVQCVDAAGVVLVDFLDGLTIKQNADWALLAGVDAVVFASVGDDHLPVRWTLSKATGEALTLTEGRMLRFTIQDDLTGITLFRIMGQGKT